LHPTKKNVAKKPAEALLQLLASGLFVLVGMEVK